MQSTVENRSHASDLPSSSDLHQPALKAKLADSQTLFGKAPRLRVQDQRGKSIPAVDQTAEHQPRQGQGLVSTAGVECGRRHQMQADPPCRHSGPEHAARDDLFIAGLPGLRITLTVESDCLNSHLNSIQPQTIWQLAKDLRQARGQSRLDRTEPEAHLPYVARSFRPEEDPNRIWAGTIAFVQSHCERWIQPRRRR